MEEEGDRVGGAQRLGGSTWFVTASDSMLRLGVIPPTILRLAYSKSADIVQWILFNPTSDDILIHLTLQTISQIFHNLTYVRVFTLVSLKCQVIALLL